MGYRTSLHIPSSVEEACPVCAVESRKGRGVGLGAGTSPSCTNILPSPYRDGMCWEIRQRYLPAGPRGRFFLKGEGDWAGVARGPWRPRSWAPSCSWQGFGTGVLSRGVLPVCQLCGLKASQCHMLSQAVLRAGGEQKPSGDVPALALIYTLCALWR